MGLETRIERKKEETEIKRRYRGKHQRKREREEASSGSRCCRGQGATSFQMVVCFSRPLCYGL